MPAKFFFYAKSISTTFSANIVNVPPAAAAIQYKIDRAGIRTLCVVSEIVLII